MRFRAPVTIGGIALGLCLAAGLVSTVAAGDPPEELKDCREAVKHYATTLQAELRAAMKEGGPTAGVRVCEGAAGPIGKTVSEERGLEIGRTSARPRNPENAPDTWESEVLDLFVERGAAGETHDTMEAWMIATREDGSRQLRYMKAIGISPLCTRCHGEKIDAEVLSVVQELYPDDQATGYRPGDLRGAFTVTLPLGAED